MAVVPPSLKPINSFLKLAKEYDKRDATIAYFCRMYAVQRGIILDSKSSDCKKFLFGLMDQLEQTKSGLSAQGNEAVSNDIVAQAHVENVTVNLFVWSDSEDRKGVLNKNVIKAFYSVSLLFEVLTQFGELNDECVVQQKYSKWKATYLHKCMQTGEMPIPGPEGSGFEGDLDVGNNPLHLTSMPEPSQSNQYEPQLPQVPTQPVQPFSYSEPPPQQPPIPKPRQVSNPSPPAPAASTGGSTSSYDGQQVDFSQAQKHCKFAMSALEYEDVATAVDNLTKALNLLKHAR